MGATLGGRGGSIVLPAPGQEEGLSLGRAAQCSGAGRPEESCGVSGRPSSCLNWGRLLFRILRMSAPAGRALRTSAYPPCLEEELEAGEKGLPKVTALVWSHIPGRSALQLFGITQYGALLALQGPGASVPSPVK